MAALNKRETEALESYRQYVAQRERCVAGDAPFYYELELLNDDAVGVIPARFRVSQEQYGAHGLKMPGPTPWSSAALRRHRLTRARRS